MRALGRLLRRVVAVRDGEVAAVLWSSALFFFLLSSYYILRPIRDEMAVAGGVRNLAWLFSATLGAMLLAHPMFTAIVVTRLITTWFVHGRNAETVSI